MAAGRRSSVVGKQRCGLRPPFRARAPGTTLICREDEGGEEVEVVAAVGDVSGLAGEVDAPSAARERDAGAVGVLRVALGAQGLAVGGAFYLHSQEGWE